MHNTILQESTSLLKELNSLNRKAQNNRFKPQPTKSKPTAQTSSSQNPQLNSANHKKNPSSQYLNGSDKINQMNNKLFEQTRNQYFNTSELDMSTPKTKVTSSPLKQHRNSEDKQIKGSNLVSRSSIKSHQRERSSDLAQGIERKNSFSYRPSPFESSAQKLKSDNSDVYGISGNQDEDSMLKKTLSYPTNTSNELNSSIKGYFVPPRKYQPQTNTRTTATSVDKKTKLESVTSLNLSHRVNLKPYAKGPSSSRNQSPDVRPHHLDSKVNDIMAKNESTKNKLKKEMKIDIPVDTNESSSNISARRPNDKARAVTPSRIAAAVTPQNKQPSLKDKLNTDQKKENTSNTSTSKNWVLTDEEKNTYGDRCPKDYTKLDFLGRGGFALVWLGQCKTTGKKVALKQMLRSNINDSQRKEQYYGQLLFEAGGSPRDEFRDYPGIDSVCSFIDLKTTKTDFWHIFELGGPTLSKMLFEIKGEFYKGERIYNVKHLELYKMFKEDSYSLKAFIRQMAEVLHLLSDYNIVHCDLKPDNILIDMQSASKDGRNFNLKLIDFGSAYNWDDVGGIGMATPEYMPPEFLQKLISTKGNKSAIEQLAEGGCQWSIDVWSLGAILVEILTGVPLWMSLKCKVELNGKVITKNGLFAVKGRAYDKILAKQKTVVDKFREFAAEFIGDWDDNELLYDLLYRMLRWDPSKRISPSEILEHPFVSQ